MRPQDIAALLRRHIMAVAVIFILTAGLAYHFEHTTPGYTETGTAAFTLPGAGFFTQQTPLLVMNELMANSVTSPRGHEQVRRAGGTGDYDVALVNLNNEDFPNYGLPYATVTATSPTAAEAQATFSAVMTVLRRNLATLQLQQGARPNSLIELRTIAPSGPVAQNRVAEAGLGWPGHPGPRGRIYDG